MLLGFSINLNERGDLFQFTTNVDKTAKLIRIRRRNVHSAQSAGKHVTSAPR